MTASARRELVRHLEAKGYGDSQPVASNDTEEGKVKNRRVELVKR